MNKTIPTVFIICAVALLLIVSIIKHNKEQQSEVILEETIENQDLESSTEEVNQSSLPEQATSTETITTNKPAIQANPSEYTLADLLEHGTEADCYTAINGIVYDLTAWVHQHPGGDRNILRICGINGTEAYNRQYGRSTNTNNILAGFERGIILLAHVAIKKEMQNH